MLRQSCVCSALRPLKQHTVAGDFLTGGQMRVVSLTTMKGDLSADGASSKVTTGYLQVAGEVELAFSLSVLSSTSLFGKLTAFKEGSFKSNLSVVGSTDLYVWLSVSHIAPFDEALSARRTASLGSLFDCLRFSSNW